MKIGIFEIEERERKSFEDLNEGNEIFYIAEKLNGNNVEKFSDVEIISTFIYSKLNESILKRLPQLRLIAVRATGVDHIDLDYCHKNNIKVANVPDYGQHTVAEHTFGLILSISHKIHDAIDRTQKGDFSNIGLRGFELAGKTLGVIGTGQIGENVIKMAKGFAMEVVAYDIKKKEGLVSELGFRYVEMDELLSSSDIITLHVPSSPKTKNMLSFEQFEKMKRGVVLINTARGSIINVNALMKSLSEGKVKAVGLDVLPGEPVVREEAEVLRSVYQKNQDLSELLADHVLLRLKNVIVTPHNAYNTDEAYQKILTSSIQNIKEYIQASSNSVQETGT